MTTINTIEDLARILRDQPTWAEALRALLLSQDLLDLPGRFNRFVEAQQETNRLTAQRLDGIDTHFVCNPASTHPPSNGERGKLARVY